MTYLLKSPGLIDSIRDKKIKDITGLAGITLGVIRVDESVWGKLTREEKKLNRSAMRSWRTTTAAFLCKTVHSSMKRIFAKARLAPSWGHAYLI